MHNKLLHKMLHSDIAENIKQKVQHIEEVIEDKLYLSEEQRKMSELQIRSKIENMQDKGIEKLAVLNAEFNRFKSGLANLAEKGKDFVVKAEKKAEEKIKSAIPGMRR